MNIPAFLKGSIAYYRRFYRLIVVAVVIAVTVICGSLFVGDSVRATLEHRVTERLCGAETIIVSGNSFLSDGFLQHPALADSEGLLVSDGFISDQGRLVPVMVWGVKGKNAPAKGSALINPTLQRELSMPQANGDLVLRLPATGLVPSGSLFVTENYSTSMRLSCSGIREAAQGGNISLKNEQILPLNVFVNRDELAEVLEVGGKVNLILDKNHLTDQQMEAAWTPEVSGLSVDTLSDGYQLTMDRVLIPGDVVTSLCERNSGANRLFSYLANSIADHGDTIPYSFVTAVDAYRGRTLQQDEIILSDYSAKRLHASVGDSIRLSYFVSRDLKVLSEKTHAFRVSGIVPIGELQQDPTLSADFPGLSDVEKCTDWNSDLPIDMDRIQDADEDYWTEYRSTPKAIIAYGSVAGDWGNVYGTATAIRFPAAPDLSHLYPALFGISSVYPKEAGLYAARNGVDFSSLFLALGFFVILSAILLMLNPLSQMLYSRRREIALLKALGFSKRRITSIYWKESIPVVLVSVVVGFVFSLLYTALIMQLLGGVWKGSTQTGGFMVYSNLWSIVGGIAGSLLIILLLLHQSISGALKEKREPLRSRKDSLSRKKILAVVFAILSIGIILLNFVIFHSVALFVTDGVVLIATAALWGDYLMARNGGSASGKLTADKLIWGALLSNRKQGMLSFFALTMGVFIVFSVGLNRKGFSNGAEIASGTGGFSLWCESSVPVYHDLNTEEGRRKLSLQDLPADASVLQCLLYRADNASCLNLNKVSRPSVLGVDMKALDQTAFHIESSIYEAPASFADLTRQQGSAYPALVDADVLIWSLGMNIGDTLHYADDQGKAVDIVIAGTISNSIFQGNILVDRAFFRKIWKENGGSDIFLLKVKEEETGPVKSLLTQALSEYGVRVTRTNERLMQFNEVTNTYLNIFMTLGGLGLLLGIMSFIIVIRKNLIMRRNEIRLYRMLGFSDRKLSAMLVRENLMIPIYAVWVGVISSLVGVSISFMNSGAGVWLLALLLALLCTVLIIAFVKRSVRKEIASAK